MNKKVLISLLIIGLAAAAIVGGTLAWFTAETDVGPNVFTAGTVEISAGEQISEADAALMANWNPGDCVEKNITVENTGTKAIALRAIVTKGWFEAGGETPWTPIGDDAAVVNDLTEWNVGADGYYYYRDADGVNKVASGDDALFNLKVCLDGAKATEEFQGKVYKVSVKLQAIQASHQKTDGEDGWEWAGFESYQ